MKRALVTAALGLALTACVPPPPLAGTWQNIQPTPAPGFSITTCAISQITFTDAGEFTLDDRLTGQYREYPASIEFLYTGVAGDSYSILAQKRYNPSGQLVLASFESPVTCTFSRR